MKGDLCFSGQEEPDLYCGSEQGGSGDVSHTHFTVTQKPKEVFLNNIPSLKESQQFLSNGIQLTCQVVL